jgi:predicted nucleic acid-binding Zn ribbon protein
LALDAALVRFTASLGITRKLREVGVITHWDRLVGEQIAKVTRPQRMENGVLHVTVSSAPWRAELTMRRAEIIEKINGIAGTKVVREIRFR